MNSNSTHKIFEDKIDKLVYDVFAEQNVETSDNEWQSLYQKMHVRRGNNNAKKIILLGTILFLLGAGSTYWFMKNNTAKNNIITTDTINKPKQINTNNISQNTQNVNPQNTTFTNTTNPQEEVNKYSKWNNNNNEKTAFEKKAKNNSNNIYTKAIQLNLEKNNRYKINKNSISEKNIKYKTELVATKKSKTYTKESDYNNEIAQNEIVENEIAQNVALENNKKEITPSDNIKDSIVESILNSNSITFNNSIVKSNDNTKPVKQPKQKRQKKAAPEHNFDNEKTMYIEAFSGMNNSFKNENSFTAFLAPSGYTNMRLQQETALPSIAAGVQFKIRKRHLTLSSGLQFLQLGDVIKYDTLYNSNSLVQAANGKTTFSYIELPLLAGYEWANKRWGFTLQGGLSTGMLTQLNGNYVSIQNFNSELFDVNQNKSYFRKAIFNVVLSPQIQYYLNETTNLFATPTYKRNLQAITKIDADLKQRYQIFGVQIGIRTKLN